MSKYEVTRGDGSTITVDADSAEQAERRGRDGGHVVTEVVEVGDDGAGEGFFPAPDPASTEDAGDEQGNG